MTDAGFSLRIESRTASGLCSTFPFRRGVLAACLLFLQFVLVVMPSLVLAEDWAPLYTVRFGNIDAIDAEDGDLAVFVKGIRNDGRFPPPMRTLVGPKIRNATFFGVIFEGWIERVTLIPPTPGKPRTVWAIPVDNREEYLTFMTGQGMSEYEGMDGVTILREMDADGSVRSWYLQWLPGNIAVFGADRDAVMAAQRLYTEMSASRGLLFGTSGRFVNPDITIRLNLPAAASWQDRETGRYWWREQMEGFVNDLLAYWKPDGARQRLIWSLAESFIMWPRKVERLDVSLWFERDGIEWSMELDGEYKQPRSSLLSCLRTVPDRTAMVSASPVTPASFSALVEWMGGLLLSAAGGVVSREARDAAQTLSGLLENGGVRELVSALVLPPAAKPELGGVRLLVSDWQFPEQADRMWERIKFLLGSDTALANAFSQMGLRIELDSDESDADSIGVVMYPAEKEEISSPYYQSTWTYRREGSLVALVMGADRNDRAERRKLRAYHEELATQVVLHSGEGGPDVRETFVRMGSDGASWLGFFEPVRFLQFCLIETGDWSPRSPDQLEPQSTQLAREMLEYTSGRAWTAAGVSRLNHWRFDGVVSWDGLTRLAAALGITEAISM